MTVRNVKASLIVTNAQRSPNFTVPLSSLRHFSVSQLIVLVLQPTIFCFVLLSLTFPATSGSRKKKKALINQLYLLGTKQQANTVSDELMTLSL